MKKKVLKKVMSIAPFVLLVTLSAFFYVYATPEQAIEMIGVENAYALIFILAILGGITTFSGVPYHLVLITLAVGGLNPLALGITTALGVMMGDSVSYYVGYRGEAALPERFKGFFGKIYAIGERHPRLLPAFFFLYGSLMPFSNDFIVISMGLARYPFFKVMIPLGLGNLVFNISLAFLATYAYELLQGIFF